MHLTCFPPYEPSHIDLGSIISQDEIVIDSHVRALVSNWLQKRVPVYELLIAHFHERIVTNNLLLEQVGINDHGEDHQQRVAHVAMAIALAIRGCLEYSSGSVPRKIFPLDLITAVGMAGYVHDVGYTFPQCIQNIAASGVGRKECLANHPQIGAKLYAALFSDSNFASYFQTYNKRMKEAATNAIALHSNDSPSFVLRDAEIAPLLIRLADKLDNTHLRIHESMVKKGRKNPQHENYDPTYLHQIIPLCINDMTYFLTKGRTPTLRVDYHVALENEQKILLDDDEPMTRNTFLRNFWFTYGKSVEAAEVVVRELFRQVYKREFAHDYPCLEIKFIFTPESSTSLRMHSATKHEGREQIFAMSC